MPDSGDSEWQERILTRARQLFKDWDIENLPKHLRRNSLDHYYLSIWPGLANLGPADELALPARPSRTEYAYIHIPFCSGVCSFCSYFITTTRDPDSDARISRYIGELLTQAEIHQADTELSLNYLYLGGGTPSLIHPDQLTRLLAGLKQLGALTPDLIGTMELHPEVFQDRGRTDTLLDILDSFGIRRVSIGFQTNTVELLDATNRRHGPQFLADGIAQARAHGFTINVDLMYGLPGQSTEEWLHSLQLVLNQSPDSLSTYFTFLDYGTRLWRSVQRDPGILPQHEQIQLQHIATQIALEERGYYELPNDFYSIPVGDPLTFSQESLPSEANSIALGAGAYGYYPGVQYANHFSFQKFSSTVRSGEAPIWRAALLSAEEELCRDIMFSLKNSPVLNLSLFKARHGVSPIDSHGRQFDKLIKLELVRIGADSISLTPKGRLLVEEIASMFEPVRQASRIATSKDEARLIRKHNFASTYSLLADTEK